MVKLLIMDDSATNLEMMQMIFSHSDYEVFTASTANEAYYTLQREHIQIVLVDWMMPDVLGIDFVRKVRMNMPERFIYLIMVTAKDGQETVIESFKAGADDFVHRPFSTRELQARVRAGARIVESHNQLEQAKRVIERGKLEWESTADAISQLVCLVDGDGRIMRVNRTIEEWHLSSPNESIGYLLWDILSKQFDDFAYQFSGVWVFVQQRIANDLGFEFMGDDLGTGHHFHVQIEPIVQREGSHLLGDNFAAVSVQNITERRTLELALQDANQQLEKQHQQSERLLLNILPQPISERLKQGEEVIADEFEAASVIFTDFVGFTKFSSVLPPKDLVKMLNEIFSVFDQLTASQGMEKIKTIGDAYMAVSGVPIPNPRHAQCAVDLGLAMLDAVKSFNLKHQTQLQIRIGIHSGPVIAGVIGQRKFAYDLWGDTVNIANRMESTGEAGRVHVSNLTANLLPKAYQLLERKPIQVKGLGEMQTYFVTHD